MDASVIIVAYNSRAYLEACLRSVLAQATADDEVIVVDNGSTDGSAEMVAELFPQVRLVRGENVGYAGGGNRGAALAGGQFLVFLNPDTVLHPGALQALIAPLRQDGTIGLTTPCITYMGRDDIVNACGNALHFTGLAYCRGEGEPRAHHLQSGEVDAVSGAAFAVRREVFHELGGFDETFFMYVEDTDLSWRARLAGYRCFYVAEAVVEHDYRPNYTPRKAFFLERNRHLMLLKNLRWTTYLRLAPALLLAEVVTTGYLLLRGPRYWPVKFRVFAAVWRERKGLAVAHRRVQGLRRRSDAEILSGMTYRLAFEQLATHWVAALAGRIFHPAFRLTRLVCIETMR